jgi:hypothetical protein
MMLLEASAPHLTASKFKREVLYATSIRATQTLTAAAYSIANTVGITRASSTLHDGWLRSSRSA